MTVFRDNREQNPAAVDAAQIAQSLPIAVAPPIATPSGGNDEALEASIAQLKAKDQEYLRLTSQQAREQWESDVRSNAAKQETSKQNRADAIEIQGAQQLSTDDRRLAELATESLHLMPQLAPWTNPITGELHWESMPQELLRQVTVNQQLFSRQAAAMGIPEGQVGEYVTSRGLVGSAPQPHYQPPQIPDQEITQEQINNFGKLEKQPDGSYQVSLATGEVFKGDAEHVMQELAKSKVHTTRWAQQIKREHQPGQPSITPLPGESLALQPQNGNGNGQETFGQWAADEQARALGFSNHQELIQWGQETRQKQAEQDQMLSDYRTDRMMFDFIRDNPDFPGTQEANDAIGEIMASTGWDVNAQNLSAAHAFAVRRGVYKPLSNDEQQAGLTTTAPQQRSGSAPPPMIRSNSPELQQPFDLWTEPLADQRKRIIREQLAEKGMQ